MKKKTAKKAVKKSEAEKSGSKNRASAAAFIRSAPNSASAAEVIAAGKKAGYRFSPAYVYAVRYQARLRTL